VNHADVGMVERGGGPDDTIDLLENIGKSGRFFERIKLDDLDRYGATNHRVERLVDRPYRALSDFLKNLKTTYRVLFFRHKQCTPTPPARRIPLELYLTPEIAARLSAPAWCKRLGNHLYWNAWKREPPGKEPNATNIDSGPSFHRITTDRFKIF